MRRGTDALMAQFHSKRLSSTGWTVIPCPKNSKLGQCVREREMAYREWPIIDVGKLLRTRLHDQRRSYRVYHTIPSGYDWTSVRYALIGSNDANARTVELSL